MMTSRAHPFIRFLLVGGLATTLHYVLLIVLMQVSGLGATLASSLGFAASAIVNYLLNRRFTFTSDIPHVAALPRFATVALTGLALNAVVMAALVHLHLVYLLAQVVATIATVLWNYVFHIHWTFGTPTTTVVPAVDREAVT